MAHPVRSDRMREASLLPICNVGKLVFRRFRNMKHSPAGRFNVSQDISYEYGTVNFY